MEEQEKAGRRYGEGGPNIFDARRGRVMAWRGLLALTTKVFVGKRKTLGSERGNLGRGSVHRTVYYTGSGGELSGVNTNQLTFQYRIDHAYPKNHAPLSDMMD